MESAFLSFKFIVILFIISHSSKAQDSSPGDRPVNNCYTFHDVDSTWEEAREACHKKGAHLVTMETTEEWSKVKSFIAEKVARDNSYTHWYIGLRKERETWKWTEAGSPGVVVATDDSRWQPNQPSNNTPEETCAEINSEYPQNVYGHFNNVYCDIKYQAQIRTSDGNPGSPRGYICENF